MNRCVKYMIAGFLLLATLAFMSGCSNGAYNTLLDDHETLQSDYDDLTATHNALVDTNADLQTDYDTASSDLAALEAIYPVKNFTTETALQTWLNGQTNPSESVALSAWITHGVELQQAALNDGYKVNLIVDTLDEGVTYFVICSAILDNGDNYVWDPDNDDLVYLWDIDDL